MAKVLPVYLYGEKILREKCLEIEKGAPIKDLIEDMRHTIKTMDACGLAAPQVGKGVMLFIVYYQDESDDTFENVYINPKFSVVENSSYSTFEEGCMSIPGIYIPVERPESIYVEYYNENWQKITERIDGFVARIFMHEYDHLQGKLIVDYASSSLKMAILPILEKFKNKENTNVNYLVR